MKKTVQLANEKQEPSTRKSVGTNSCRKERIGYSRYQHQISSNSSSSVRNIRETFERGSAKNDCLKNGDSFRYHRSDSVKSGNSDDASVNGQTNASNVSVVSLPGDSNDVKIDVQNIDSGGQTSNTSPVSLRSSEIGPEKAQDRLVKSHSYIEELQQNLATKPSSATVEAFKHEYLPALGRRSHSTTVPHLTNGKQNIDSSNRQSHISKADVKVDVSGSSLKKRRLFFSALFASSVTKLPRKNTDSQSNHEGKTRTEVNHAAVPVDDVSIQLESKQTQNQESVEATSKSCIERAVETREVLSGDNIDGHSELEDKGRNPSSCTNPGDVSDSCRSSILDTSKQQISSRPEPPKSPKPVRISWTTKLIQKLTEEETRKKNKPQISQKPRRLVRFPQKNPPKVVKQERPAVYEGSKIQRESDLLHPSTDACDSYDDCRVKDPKENPSGITIDEKSNDAYASVISQLATSTTDENSEQESELNGEDLLLKQKKLEEIRAAIAREECICTSSDDESVTSAAITASTGNIVDGRRKEPKPSGIRRLLPQGLFVQKHQHVNRSDDDAVLESLLKRPEHSRVYPARPVLETAFLSDSESKLPVRSEVRQQQRSQSSSPASRHKQASPRTRRHQQDRDQAIIQENEQNASRISYQARSKSLSPARDRRTTATSPRTKRTVPDTSMILEERLQHIRRELTSPPARDANRPSSASPTDRPNRVHQKQNSLPSYSSKTTQQEKVLQNRGYSGGPVDAYYHSPPSRRRPLYKDAQNRDTTDDFGRKVSGSSSTSSSSTIVAESPSISSLSWNPLLVNLENQAISGSPDIRKLQQQRQQHANDSGLYGDTRRDVHRDVRGGLVSRSFDSPDMHYHSIPGSPRGTQGFLQIHHNPSLVQQRSPTSVPSGRVSAPPIPSYYIENYPRRRVISPEPPRTRQNYEYGPSSRRSLSQPPIARESDQRSSQSPLQPVIVRLIRPVGGQVQTTSSKSHPMQEGEAKSKETQTARSYIQQQYRQLGEALQRSPQAQYKKLSRQEIEALYWETQKLREGLSSLSQHISPEGQRMEKRYHSAASLPQQMTSAHRNVHRSEQSSPMLFHPDAAPRQPFRTQSAVNVGSGYGSVIVRPQPIYNNVQLQQPMHVARTSHDGNPKVPRARSASPGPNSDKHLSSRSMSLPRSMPASTVPENPSRKVSDDRNNFARGVPQRNTIGPIRTSNNLPQNRQQSTPTIYEEPRQRGGDNVQIRYGERYKHADGEGGNKNSKSQDTVDIVMVRSPSSVDGNDPKKSGSGKRNKRSSSEQPVSHENYYPPIFKRGSLISTSTCDGMDSPMIPKRVSFTRSYTDEPLYWPTRNGPAPEPPTRQRKPESSDSDVFLPSDEYSAYANAPQAPNRPLPPIPRDVNGDAYGVLARKGRDSKSPASGFPISVQRWQQQSESESGSEAGEVQRILQQGCHGRGTYFRFPEEEWGANGKARGPAGADQSVSNVGRDEEVRRGGGGGGRSGRRDEPRRHTLSGDHHHHQQGGGLARSMDLEMSSKSQRRKSPLPRGYPPPSSAMLFDDDPGIMSEVETSSTGFRRGGKQRSSLPVVRTPSKTLERPLGLVFLQYRSETKRALLPNEITSIDTVKALFVRSFPKQLTMEYLDSPHVKIYIHDSSKDMFYELEDLRSHLRDIRDRSVLRLFESTDMNGGVLPGAGVGVVAPPMWDQDQSYFSEPEFDSEYQHQHIHKSKTSNKSGSSGVPPQSPYYMTHSYPPGGTQGAPGGSSTLPRGGPLLRTYSPAVVPQVPADRIKTLPQTDRLHSESGYMSSPERGGPRAYPAAAYNPGGPGYEDPYYSQYASRSGSITPVIDEEASDTELIDESYSLYGVKLPTAGRPVVTPQPRSQFPAPAVVPYDATRIRVEHMERQLANLTGLVQKALTQTPTPREYLQVPPPPSTRDVNYRNERTERDRHKPAPPPKPVSLSPGQYEGRHVYRDLQLTPEMYNQLRGLQKKAKDLRQEVRNLRRMSQAQAHSVRETIRDTFMKIRAMLLIGGEEAWAISGDADKMRLNREEDAYKQEMLRLEKDLTELESTVEELRGNVINRKTRVNMSDVENMALILSKSSKTVADLKVRFPNLQEGMKGLLSSEMEKVVREEKFLKEEPDRLESALRRCKKLTGTLVTLKRLASVQEQRLPPSATPDSRLSPTMGLGGDSDTPITPPAHGKPSAIPARGIMAPTIGGDSSISRQRPENALDALLDELQTFARPPSRASSGHNPPMADIGRKGSIDSAHTHAPTLPSSTGTSSLRRLHSYPSSSDGGGNSPPTVALARLQVSGSSGSDAPKSPASSPKPPVPERNSELLSHLAGRRIPPPPPPRTSSRSPLASPTSPSLPPRGQHPPSQPQMGVGGGTLLRRGGPGRSSLREPLHGTPGISVSLSTAMSKEDPNQPQSSFNPLSVSNSSSCESINSQEGLQQNKPVSTSSNTGNKARQEILEQRHQELLRKQRALQEQYARLQQLQRSGGGGLAVVPPPDLVLKKTGSESNLLAKMGLGHGLSAAAPISGSLTHLAAVAASANQQPIRAQQPQKQAVINTASATATTNAQPSTATTNKIYETDIL